MQATAESTSPTTDAASDPYTVLIVDDDRAVAEGLREFLEDEGYAVATASDGLDALAQLRAGLRPSMILLDLMMPRMDGWDFRRAQVDDAELKEIPVVVITAAGFSRETVRAQLGDIELLPKLASVDQLLDVVRRACA